MLFQGQEFREQIIHLNTTKQLYERGIDSEGNSLGEYSPTTVFIKLFERSPTQVVDRVTLKDTGEFYKSFNLYQDSERNIHIEADTVKDDTDLVERYGAILGLTNESMAILIDTALPIVINKIKNEIAV
jgi:hypothetical protein